MPWSKDKAPSSWNSDIELLGRRLEERREVVESVAVQCRWWTPTRTYIPALGGSLSQSIRYFRGVDRPTSVALYEGFAVTGAQAFLVIAVQEKLSPRSGRGRGLLHRDLPPSEAVCLEMEGKMLFPIYPPLEPSSRTPRL